MDKAFCFDSIVRGHYVCQAVWTPFLGEVLTATPEPKNDHNRHAVCVKDGEIAGHVPRIECSLLYSGHSQSFTLGAVMTTIMNVVKCGIYSRAATILLGSSSSAASIRGRLLNGVRCLFE